MKTIGLIGGMSWESSAHYYAALNRGVAKRLGGLHSAKILMHSVDFAPIAELQSAGEWDKTAQILADAAIGLQRTGAELIGIATNTMHIVAERVEAAIDVPLIHIAEPTAQQLVTDGYEKVALLGTRFTMEMRFYTDRLRAHGLIPLVPDVDITNLNAIIYDELCRGIISDSSRQTYIAAIARLQQRGAEAVILGCTEIAMLVDDNCSPIPTYDTTQLHADSLLDAALA